MTNIKNKTEFKSKATGKVYTLITKDEYGIEMKYFANYAIPRYKKFSWEQAKRIFGITK